MAQPPICEFGWKAVDFSLTGVDGEVHTLAGTAGPKGTVIMFICNHCPYVRSVIDRIVDDCRQLQAEGIGVAAIMSNDTKGYPADSFDNMKIFAAENGFTFPYLADQTQEVGRAYDAMCTPDFFGFNADLELQYRGRLDASRREPVPDAPRELLEAMRLIARTGKGPEEQNASIGCSIKWREVA